MGAHAQEQRQGQREARQKAVAQHGERLAGIDFPDDGGRRAHGAQHGDGALIGAHAAGNGAVEQDGHQHGEQRQQRARAR